MWQKDSEKFKDQNKSRDQVDKKTEQLQLSKGIPNA